MKDRRAKAATPRWALILPFVLVPFLSGCALLGIGGVTVISVEEEWEMGRQLEAELARELPLSQDAAVVGWVDGVGQRLVAQTEMADLDWRFHVVEHEAVNAFNVPGGLVYVYDGLIEEAGSAAEVVAVIAHEVGHGVARHGAERLSQQYELALLSQIVLGQDPGLVQEIVAQIVAAGALARFSRDQEFEADELAVRAMPGAGYHPQGKIDLLELLLSLREREPGTVEQFFATHPAPAERIDHAEAIMEELDNLAGLQMEDAEFDRIQQRVQAQRNRQR